ncbi:MAG: glycosyltransferase family 2 protein [Bacteroidales bacterium]|nr:glycosyltransferase family 2 protein [Bacteroidales bacterium]
MKTAVVILNYNTRNYLEQFLPGLIASCEGLDAGVVVADNASADTSVEFMKTRFPEIPLIELDKNYGFTGGYNRALEQVEADYYVLINSDIEVPQDWLQPLVEWMDSHPECGACGPKLISWHQRDTFEYAGAAGGLIDRYGYPFCRGRILQKIEKDHGQYDEPADVLWCSGACLMVRSNVWKALGGLDERFFAHMEEIDLCWRMQLRGWKVTVVPASWIYHIGGGTLPNESPFKLRLNFRNNLLLLENNLPSTLGSRLRTRVRILTRMCLDGLSALVYLFKGKMDFFRAVVQAHREYRQLRRPGELLPDAHRPEGLYKGWIVPIGLFGKK